MAERYGVGIIGAGSIAGAHIDALKQLGDQCKVVAISDLDAEKARRIASDYGVEADTYADYRDMLARVDIDVVHICTPPYARGRLVTDALAAGKHVMCEKPFAASLEECDEMLAAAERHGRKLAVMLQTRCETDVRIMRRLVRGGTLGPILYANAFNHHWRGDAYYRKEWRGTWEKERGGTLMNLGIHTLDIVVWILGELDSVKADIATLGHDIETDDVSTAILKFKTGAIGQFGCTTTYPISGSAMQFAGKARSVGYPLQYAAVRENEDGFPLIDDDALREIAREAETVVPMPEGFAGPIQDLFAAIREDREPLSSGHEVRRTVEAVTAIYKAATTGTEVKLPISRDDPWYTTDGFHRAVKRGSRQ
ncbi:Gfo/Idh/MocA family protein [Cohnella sp. GCM10027633]|uniref:Gfo/Idh/MocA family protein n=1 Tax=unclassified Cohnella TaxID=2636738 RepID=UPI00363E080C